MKKVSVVGAGTMGRGIAQAAALAGHSVVLYDISGDVLSEAKGSIDESIEKGVALGKTSAELAARAKSSIRLATEIDKAADSEFLVEAAPENLAIKRTLLADLDHEAPESTIFASNTSSLSIGALASATKRPDRVLGLHFFNPAHIMRLVEVIRGPDTSDETLQAATAFVEGLGKTPVYCKDTPAFIVNRVARPFYGEALRLLGEGATSVDQVDQLIRSVGFRMGPFELIDLIGCDVNLTVTETVYDAYYHDAKYRPHPIQRQMVESGRLGRKTGRGFYDYD